MECTFTLFTFENGVPLMRYGVAVVWHYSLPLMNGFNKTEPAVFSCRLCFLRAFPFISLLSNSFFFLLCTKVTKRSFDCCHKTFVVCEKGITHNCNYKGRFVPKLWPRWWQKHFHPIIAPLSLACAVLSTTGVASILSTGQTHETITHITTRRTFSKHYTVKSAYEEPAYKVITN